MSTLFYFFLLLLSVALYFVAPSFLQIGFVEKAGMILGCCLLFFVFFHKENFVLKGHYLKHSNIFILGFVLVHFQIYCDFLLGNSDWFGFDYFIDKKIVPKAMCISLIALISFLIGYTVEGKSFAYHKEKLKMDSPKLYGLIIYILLLLFVVFADKKYFMGGYGTYNLGLVSEYLQNYLLCTFVIYTISVSMNFQGSFGEYIRKYKIIIPAIVIYLGLVIVSGDRGPIFQVILCIVGGYLFSTKTRIKGRYFIILSVVGILFFSTLGYLRAIDAGKDFSVKMKESQLLRTELSSAHSFSPSTFELAASVRTFHASVKYCEVNGYHYGLFQTYQLMGVIPGLGILFKEITGYQEKELSSAEFLTRQILGKFPSHGLGTTCVADIYLDFGVIGVFVFFLFFGCFLKKIELTSFLSSSMSIFCWIVALVFFYKAIYIGRSSIIILFRECIQVYLLIYVLKILNYIFRLR